MIELGVEIVEEGHRGVAGLLPVHLQSRQNEGQEEAPRLTGRRFEGGVAAVEKHHHCVAVGTGQGPPRGSLASREGTELSREGLSHLGCGRRDLGTEGHAIVLVLRAEAITQGGGEACGIRCTPLPETSPEIHEALGPDIQIGALLPEGSIALGESPLEGADVGPVRRPEGPGRAVEELPAVTHGAADDAQAVGGVDDHLETPLVLPGNDVATIHAKLPAAWFELDLKSVGAVVPGHLAAGTKASGSTANERWGVLGPKGPPAREETHRLQKRGLALRVPSTEHVETRLEIKRHITNVAKIVDGEVSQPDHAWPLEPHGHDDVPVVTVLVSSGTEESLTLRIPELEDDLFSAHGGQKLQKVLGIESHLDGFALVVDRE